MKKFMKFTMFEKDSKDTKYRDDPYRAVIFPIDESGSPVCPNGKKFNYIYSRAVRGNKYGRTEEFFPMRRLQRVCAQGQMLQMQGQPNYPSERRTDAVSQRSFEQSQQHTRRAASYEPQYSS